MRVDTVDGFIFVAFVSVWEVSHYFGSFLITAFGIIHASMSHS